MKKNMLGLVTRVGKLMIDVSGILQIASFNSVKSTFKEQEFEDEAGKKISAKRINYFLIKQKYEDWKLSNPEEGEKVSLQDYINAQEGQLKAIIGELRIILSFMLLITMLGSDDEDDWYSHENNHLTKMVYKSFLKAQQELLFYYNPLEMINLTNNPIAVLSLGSKIFNAFANTLDETRDTILQEDYKGFINWELDSNDKTPYGYYSTKFIKGINGLRSVVDIVYEKDSQIIAR
jgi:hypothetical protein